MIVLLGCAVVLGAVILGFSIAGGHIGALIHPSELLTIGGASLGALIIMSPKKVLVDIGRGIVQAVKGSPYEKAMYQDMFKVLYDLLRLARRDGILALENHIGEPSQSEIFQRYPRFISQHHAVEFLCGGLAPLVEGNTHLQTASFLDAELRTMEEEHHAPATALSKVADALPGFGIVAAVLGIVITMGAIDGPVEEVGHKVGAALVGTFLGILLSYGFFGPMASRMEFLGAAEMAFFRTMAAIVVSFAETNTPKAAVEVGRRGVASDLRPSLQEMDKMLDEADSR